MTEYDNTNSGILSVNDRRTKPTHPNFKGQCTIKTPDGELVEYWISGWEKSGRKGPFVSLSFEAKEDSAKRNAGGKENASSGGFLSGGSAVAEKKTIITKASQDDFDDSIPF